MSVLQNIKPNGIFHSDGISIQQKGSHLNVVVDLCSIVIYLEIVIIWNYINKNKQTLYSKCVFDLQMEKYQTWLVNADFKCNI